MKGLLNFFPMATSHGMWILVPQPGIEPMPPAMEVQYLNHWTAREVQQESFLIATPRSLD